MASKLANATAALVRDNPQHRSLTAQPNDDDTRLALQMEEDAKIAKDLQLKEDIERAMRISLEREFKYKYLKYKTKYLTLKNNTNF